MGRNESDSFSNEIELRNILYTASLGLENPIAIRYPRGRGSVIDWQKDFQKVEIGKGKRLQSGSELAIISVGTIRTEVEKALQQLQQPEKIAHYDLGFVKPLDEEMLVEIFQQYKTVITVEDGVISGGGGEAVLAFANQYQFTSKIINLGIPDEFIEQGTTAELRDLVGISAERILEKFEQVLTKLTTR